MAFAVAGILGHFSKTLLLFFIPQIINFILSAPQLFGLVPCPRHRVPRYIPFFLYMLLFPKLIGSAKRFDPETNIVHPSIAVFERPPSKLTTVILKVLAALRLTRLEIHPRTHVILSATNLTLLNAILVFVGPMREATLTSCVIVLQVMGSVLAFWIRYGLASLVYDGDRR